MDLPWVSHGSPMGVPWVSHGTLKGFPETPMDNIVHRCSWVGNRMEFISMGAHGLTVIVHECPWVGSDSPLVVHG